MSSDMPICVTCGTQFPAAAPGCAICEDPRQFVGWNGQEWTTLGAITGQYRNVFEQDEAHVFSIRTQPKFAIGQRAQIVRTPEGNVLWDCVSLLDAETEGWARSIGGIAAIAISHPHYHATMAEWSERFGGAPIHLHEATKKWVMRPHKNIEFWSGDEKKLFGGLTLVNTPGHFRGYQVLHSRGHTEGRGAVFAGDQPRVCMDRGWVSFMYSYPNFIPLRGDAVRDILQRLGKFEFDRLYGAVPGWVVARDAHAAIERSAKRYLDAIGAGL